MSLVLELPLRGSQLIEASAGTGKTFTIALLYVRLVLGHGGPGGEHTTRTNGFHRPLTPPEILVVTFTEAATQELRSRIRERLVDAAIAFREPVATADLNSTDPLLSLRNEYAPEVWKQCARRLQVAAEWMDDAAVSTIHSWCYKMLQEHAFDSGSLFSQELISDQSDLVTEAVQDYWRTRFYPLSPALAKLVHGEFESPAVLEKEIRTLLQREDARIEFQGEPLVQTPLQSKLEAVRDSADKSSAFEQEARAAWQADSDNLTEVLDGLRGAMNGNSFRGKDDDAVFSDWINGVKDWASGGESTPFVAKLGSKTMKLKKGHAPPDHAFFSLVESWQASEAEIPDMRPDIMADARGWVIERMERQLDERAEMGFDDLLRHLDKSLSGKNGEVLAQRIREQFPVAMIDEFQDTDPLQYRIFQTVYRADENDNDTGIILIGDPKQAIYSFRGADIGTYLQARRVIGERLHTLGTNFRSCSGMVDAVNTLFAHADQSERGAFRFKSTDGNPLPFHSVEAKGQNESLELGDGVAPAMTAWWYAPGDYVREKDYQEALAVHAAEALSGWLHDSQAGKAGFRHDGELRPLKASDVAILVRDRNEASAVRDALSQRDLPSVYLSDRDSVFSSDEARDVLYWLEAVASPESEGMVRTALSTPTLGISLSRLDEVNNDELGWETYHDRFFNYRNVWRRTGVLPMLRLLIHEFGIAERLLAGPRGERRLTNLLHLAEWAQQTSELLDGEQALIRELLEHINSPGGEDQILRLESDDDLIKVVTIHKAKGLEYPVVLLPFITGWTEVDGRRGRPVYEKDGTVIELGKKAEAADAFASADDERLSEDMRLLYVAMTRARHATFVGVAPIAKGNAKKPQVHKGAIGYLLAGGEVPRTAGELHDAMMTAFGDSTNIVVDEVSNDTACTPAPSIRSEGIAVPSRRPSHKAFEPWWVSSYSGIVQRRGVSTLLPDTAAEATQADEDIDLGVPPPLALSPGIEIAPDKGSIHALPKGPEAGTFLHGLLEWAGTQGFETALAETGERQRLIKRRCEVRGWGAYSEGVDEWLVRQLSAPLLPDAPSMTPTQLRVYLVEHDFWIEATSVSTRAMDRLIAGGTLGGISRPSLSLNWLQGMLKGFIDLLFEHEGRYYVLDWKSNWLGPDVSHYHNKAMRQSMSERRHDVQMCLYLLALHRHLRQRIPEYDYNRDVGGAMYVFLRGAGAAGAGVYYEKPPFSVIDGLDQLFSGLGNQKSEAVQKPTPSTCNSF